MPNLANPSFAESTQPVEPPEVLIDHMTLYHGSATPGITEMLPADEYTVGTGVYLTDNPNNAAGYARRSAYGTKTNEGIVYAVGINNMKLANLDNPDKLQEVMEGFSGKLTEQLSTLDEKDWLRRSVLERTLEAIQLGVMPGQVKNVTQSCSDLFTKYLSRLGYDGLKTQEGGETGFVGNHSSYVIFDPSKTTVEGNQEVQIS